jgi:hypothetical protein
MRKDFGIPKMPSEKLRQAVSAETRASGEKRTQPACLLEGSSRKSAANPLLLARKVRSKFGPKSQLPDARNIHSAAQRQSNHQGFW